MSDHPLVPSDGNKETGDQTKPGATDSSTGDRPSGASNDNPDQRQNPQSEKVAGDKKSGARFFRRLADYSGAVTGFATVGILAVTTAYVWVSYGQLAAMKEQAADAQKSFFATERPWVTLRHPPGADELVMCNAQDIVRNDTTGNFEWTVTFFLTNVGHSPAKNVFVRAKLASINPSGPDAMGTFHRWRDFSCEEGGVYPSAEAPAGLIVFPGQSRGPEPVTTATPAQYVVGGAQLYLMVCITYESMLATSHHRTQVAILVTDTRGPITPQTAVVPFANQRFSIPLEFQSSAAD